MGFSMDAALFGMKHRQGKRELLSRHYLPRLAIGGADDADALRRMVGAAAVEGVDAGGGSVGGDGPDGGGQFEVVNDVELVPTLGCFIYFLVAFHNMEGRCGGNIFENIKTKSLEDDLLITTRIFPSVWVNELSKLTRSSIAYIALTTASKRGYKQFVIGKSVFLRRPCKLEPNCWFYIIKILFEYSTFHHYPYLHVSKRPSPSMWKDHALLFVDSPTKSPTFVWR